MNIVQVICGMFFGGLVGFVGSQYGYGITDWPFWTLMISGFVWSLFSALAAQS